jgi:hypothetical protein
MWRCSKCGEALHDAFEMCWKCGTTAAGEPAREFRTEPDDPAVPDPGPSPDDYEAPCQPPSATDGGDPDAGNAPPQRALLSALLWALRIGGTASVGCGIATHFVFDYAVSCVGCGRTTTGFLTVVEGFFFLMGFFFFLLYLLIRPPIMGCLLWTIWIIGLVAAIAAVFYTFPP